MEIFHLSRSGIGWRIRSEMQGGGSFLATKRDEAIHAASEYLRTRNASLSVYGNDGEIEQVLNFRSESCAVESPRHEVCLSGGDL